MDDLLRILDWCLPQWKLWNLGLLLLDGMEPNDATARFSWGTLVSSPRFFALFSCLFWWTLVQNSEHRRNRQGPSSIRGHVKQMPTAATKRFHLQTLELSSFFICPVSLSPYRPKPSPFASIPSGYENLNGFSLLFVYAHAPPPPNFTPCSCLRPVTLYPATVVSRTRAARFGISRRTAPPSRRDTHSHIHSQSVSQSVSTTRAQSIFARTRGRDSRLG
ncbi:hypothetical protein DER46DRAFT_374703 [Fusarium sp. MPI-SDFR-AT-0072]|nr:hypothetical protein DER46DRAFT_374703 [Fusarium sp. MPI-SDFR-AT-0072]